VSVTVVRFVFLAFASLLGVIVLAACTQTPNTAFVEHEALEDRLPLHRAKPIAAIVRDLAIRPPDPSLPTSLLQQIVAELRKADPGHKYEGATYRLSEHNALDRGWLLQTPNWWGRRAADLPAYEPDCPTCLPEIGLPECTSDSQCGTGACRPLRMLETVAADAGKKVCVGHSDETVDRLYRMVASARYRLDIASLQPVPDGRYLAALHRGLMQLARSGNTITVRVLIGIYPPLDADVEGLLEDLTRGLQAYPQSRLSVHVAAMRSCLDPRTCGFSWNHAKILVVDGREAVVGGHNMWTRDYLLDRPIHDLSMYLRGPAAGDASAFLDKQWAFVCAHNGDRKRAVEVRSLTPGDKSIGERCPARLFERMHDRLRRVGSVPVLAIGRMGAGINDDFANHNDLARDLMLGSARQTVRIVQQDFGFNFGQPQTVYPESSMERIADFLLKDQGDAFIVLSNYRARGRSGATYSNRLPIETTARKFREVARRRSTLPDPVLDALLCRRLHMAPFRFGPDDTWPDDVPIGSHAKFWMIDDRAFYIGSDNFYPVDLQEFGYIVEAKAAVADVLGEYWEPVWRWSSPHAISGSGAARCIFGAPDAGTGSAATR
jgi:phosphatidylserine/phosphatidylglycerophosphate/cardiolipin synthase-like enzyme